MPLTRANFRPSFPLKVAVAVAIVSAVLVATLAACAQQAESEAVVYRIGAVHPLTGDGAEYGLPVQRVIERAVQDLNTEWAARNLRLEVVFADGECNAEAARAAAQRLVEEESVRVIFGGTCSDETLGMSPYTEVNRVLLLTPLSSSDQISDAGDYVFRMAPRNSAQVAAMVAYLEKREFRRYALLTTDTKLGQDLRRSYLASLPTINGEIVADEVIAPDAKNVAAEAARIAAASPDAVIVLPQTIPDAGLYVTALHHAGVDAQGIGSDIVGLSQTIAEYGAYVQGYIVPTNVVKGEGEAAFAALKEDTDCDLGIFCATPYDGIFLLGEALAQCGDQDTDCIRDFLYATNDWEGPFYGVMSFDANGDLAGSFQIDRIEGETQTPTD